MGWWGDSKGRDENMKQWAKRKYDFNESNRSHEVIETGLVKRNTLYMACKFTDKETNESYIYGMVILINWKRGRYNMMIKEIDEFCGPSYTDCPKKVFLKLTPLDKMPKKVNTEYAVSWREEVAARFNAVK